MPGRRGIGDWFPTSGEAEGSLKIKGRIGGKGRGRMRRGRRNVNSVKVRTTWIPWMLASTERGAYETELVPMNHQDTSAMHFNPWYADSGVNRRTMMANQSKIIKWQGAIWAVPRLWEGPSETANTNEDSNVLVMWYWHKQKLDPSGTLTENSNDWAINADQGSGYPTETDALMMRKDLNKWGQGWARRVINAGPLLVGEQNGYTVPAEVAGDRVAYNVPAIEPNQIFLNLRAYQNVFPLRIPGPKLPVTLDQGEVLTLRVSGQIPPVDGTSLMLNSSQELVSVFPNGRFLVTT